MLYHDLALGSWPSTSKSLMLELQNPILVDFLDFCDLIGVDKSVLNDCSLSRFTKVLNDKVQKIL